MTLVSTRNINAWLDIHTWNHDILLTCQPMSFTIVIVKLDIDTPEVELPMVQQLVDMPELQRLVDVFYFEHHVQLTGLRVWGKMKGSVLSSLELFSSLRNKGVDAHYWP